MFKILLALLSINSYAQEYYKKCNIINNVEVCERLTDNSQRIQQSDIKPDLCYKYESGIKTVYFKVKDVFSNNIIALAEVYNNNQWDNKIVVDTFYWNSNYFNNELKMIDCKQTPHINDNEYLSQYCSVYKYSTGIRNCVSDKRINKREREL